MRAVIAAVLAVALVLVLLALLVPAHGQQVGPGGPCDTHAKMVAYLRQKYGEMLLFQGLAKNGGLLEILAGPTPSYSILMTMPGMPSCLIGAGDQWEAHVAVAGRDL